ncbi:MAG: hypothetical protein KJ060_10565 [Candidatus Hydrogenedentes bacterium]|nr:hypothetical protein [Candidatus Hydrogenedentota bacterium]
MAFPILEGVQLLHAARGLLHEIKGIGGGGKAKAPNNAVTMTSTSFAKLLEAAQQGNTKAIATKQDEGTDGVSSDRFSNLPTNLAARLEEEIAAFREELSALFDELPIDDLPELVLTSDAEGNVVVANDHPDAEMIEALFKAHPMLANAFHRLSVNASLVRTAAVQFPASLGYLRDPQGTTMAIGESLSGANSPRNFQLTIGPNGVFTSFGSTTTDTSGDSTTA